MSRLSRSLLTRWPWSNGRALGSGSASRTTRRLQLWPAALALIAAAVQPCAAQATPPSRPPQAEAAKRGDAERRAEQTKPIAFKHLRRIVLDPGHGGDNLGALGSAGIREKVLCLDVARRAAAWISERSDLEVLLTRDRDVAVELRQRPRLANDWKGDALISIHANAHENGEASGMEVFFLAADASAEASRDLVEREEGIRPADATAGLAWSVGGIVADLELAAQHRRAEWLALALGDALKIARPQARFRGVRQAAFGVLKEARMPAVVLEIGYITHAVEGPQLTEAAVQDQFSRAILKALQALELRMAAEARAEKAASAKTARPPRRS